tara:strand:+ start:27219 stop:27575 length:357 start_codon:yes stop_codon:yes gene_type:complete
VEINQQLKHFVHAQVDFWNKGDKAGFLGCYRDISPNGLSVEIVGGPNMGAQTALAGMWSTQSDIRIEIVCAVVVGNEAVTHHRNYRISSGELSSDTLETYCLEEGKLTARYFVSQAWV